MVTLVYKGRQIGPICRSVANLSKGKIQAVCDKTLTLGQRLAGTVIRWDSKLPLMADRDLNRADAVKLSRNKRDSRLMLSGVCPTTWTSWLRQRKQFTYPCIVRARRHHAAQKFHVCHNLREVEAALKKCGYQKWYISPIVPKDLEYRIFCFQGRVIKVVRRFHNDPNVVAWNIANGGKSKRLLKESWPIQACQAAILAGVRLKLDWYAADVIVDRNTSIPYVLELNTAPGLGEDKTFKRLAKVFVWADENEKPGTGKGKTWQELIHPALLKARKTTGADEQEEEDGLDEE